MIPSPIVRIHADLYENRPYIIDESVSEPLFLMRGNKVTVEVVLMENRKTFDITAILPATVDLEIFDPEDLGTPLVSTTDADPQAIDGRDALDGLYHAKFELSSAEMLVSAGERILRIVSNNNGGSTTTWLSGTFELVEDGA